MMSINKVATEPSKLPGDTRHRRLAPMPDALNSKAAIRSTSNHRMMVELIIAMVNLEWIRRDLLIRMEGIGKMMMNLVVDLAAKVVDTDKVADTAAEGMTMMITAEATLTVAADMTKIVEILEAAMATEVEELVDMVVKPRRAPMVGRMLGMAVEEQAVMVDRLKRVPLEEQTLDTAAVAITTLTVAAVRNNLPMGHPEVMAEVVDTAVVIRNMVEDVMKNKSLLVVDARTMTVDMVNSRVTDAASIDVMTTITSTEDMDRVRIDTEAGMKTRPDIIKPTVNMMTTLVVDMAMESRGTVIDVMMTMTMTIRNAASMDEASTTVVVEMMTATRKSARNTVINRDITSVLTTKCESSHPILPKPN